MSPANGSKDIKAMDCFKIFHLEGDGRHFIHIQPIFYVKEFPHAVIEITGPQWDCLRFTFGICEVRDADGNFNEKLIYYKQNLQLIP